MLKNPIHPLPRNAGQNIQVTTPIGEAIERLSDIELEAHALSQVARQINPTELLDLRRLSIAKSFLVAASRELALAATPPRLHRPIDDDPAFGS